MIISRTPFRISFFGGGTDYPAWYRTHGGAVLAASIDKYCYLTCRYLPPFFEHRYRVVYSRIDTCQTIDEISHPAAREILRYMNIDRGVEIHHDGDLPARSGMGSSSAFTVGLLHALSALKGEMRSKQELALDGIHVEQELLRETVGSQDQVMAAHGGIRHVQFHADGQIAARPVPLPRERVEELQSHLMLFYTGIIRTASDVAQSYALRLEDRRRELSFMRELVDEGMALLGGCGDLVPFGKLMHEAWQTKRCLSKMVSNSKIDALYEKALDSGAIGGKLTGAGGGGFMLLFVPPDRHEDVRCALHNLLHVPFNFEFAGSQIVFYEPGQDYQAHEKIRAGQNLDTFRELKEVG